MSDTLSKSAFAHHLGWNRSSVTRAAQAGRLVLTPTGEVEVEASMEKLKATASPYPHHRAHAQQLLESRESTTAGPDARGAESIEDLNLRLKRAEANKREHEAEMARMDREKQAGALVSREIVDYVLTDYGATLRSLLEGRADRLAPVIAPLQTLDATHVALAEADEALLREMEQALKRKVEAFEAA